MASPFLGDGEPTHYDDVVGVEVTIDGMLVIADLLHLVDFSQSLGIRPNIPYEDQRKIVWDQVTRDLTAQGILTAFGHYCRVRNSWILCAFTTGATVA